MDPRRDPSRVICAPRGMQMSCKSWLTEAPLRMLMNNLDPEVAEHPEELVVYGGIGRAARDWAAYDRIVETLRRLEDDETLLIQSGKPVGVFKTHADAPRVPHQRRHQRGAHLFVAKRARDGDAETRAVGAGIAGRRAHDAVAARGALQRREAGGTMRAGDDHAVEQRRRDVANCGQFTLRGVTRELQREFGEQPAVAR